MFTGVKSSHDEDIKNWNVKNVPPQKELLMQWDHTKELSERSKDVYFQELRGVIRSNESLAFPTESQCQK